MAFLGARARRSGMRKLLAFAVMFACAAGSQTPPPGQVPPGQDVNKPAAPPQNAPAPPPPESPPDAQQQQPSLPMEFESHGMEYEALTKDGVTVMFAPLPPRIKDYNIVQVTVTNGSLVSWTVRPTDFGIVRQDGTTLQPVSADDVVQSLLAKASRSDVIKLQLLYEDSIYALSNFRSTNGYEQRRESAMAQFVNRGLKAAAEASAITLVPIRLKPGDSTDGAVFFENRTKEKTIGPGRFVAHTCGQKFEFGIYQEPKLK